MKTFKLIDPITSRDITMNDDEMLIYETVKIKDHLKDDKVLNGNLKLTTRKFGLLSYEELEILHAKVMTGIIMRYPEGAHIASQLQSELKEELEIRG